jgi:ketosteroid isomerase-like protein
MNPTPSNIPDSAMSRSKAQVENVILAWAEGIRTKDVEAVAAQFADAPVNFFLAPPLVADDPLRHNLAAWFDTFDGPIGYELRDMVIVAGDDVAWCHALNHLVGTKKDGGKPDLWFRVTLCLQCKHHDWKITHAHESVPFLMDGSEKAALDLKP